MDLPLDRVNVGNCRIVEVLAEDEGRQFLEEAFARLQIARDRPRLDEGGPFPVLSPALVIEHCRLDRDGKWRRARVWPKPQIRAEDIAVAGSLLQDANQAPQQPGEGFRSIVAIGDDARLRIVEDDKIDIGRIVELAGTKLAHSKHDDAGGGGRRGTVLQHELAAFMRAEQQMIDRRRNGRLCKIAEPPRRLTAAEKPRQVRKRDSEGDLALRPPQSRHDLRIRQRRPGCIAPPGHPCGLDPALQKRRQRLGQQCFEDRRVATRRIPQEWREREGCNEKILERRVRGNELRNVVAAFRRILENRKGGLGVRLARRANRHHIDIGQRPLDRFRHAHPPFGSRHGFIRSQPPGKPCEQPGPDRPPPSPTVPASRGASP